MGSCQSREVQKNEQSEEKAAGDKQLKNIVNGVSVDDTLNGGPIPPWERYGLPPPGIVLATSVPMNFQPFRSNPNVPGSNQFERLALISSRVDQCRQVAASVLPNVGVVAYDWRSSTLQELMREVKSVLGPSGRVLSIAVIAPGNKPGSVALLDGYSTNAEKVSFVNASLRSSKPAAAGLGNAGELAQFWRALSGFVRQDGEHDGRHIDFIGCRIIESPSEGAALLKGLWELTAVPFAAADDVLGGYNLSTFIEVPATGSLSLISSTIKAIDMYFDRGKLLSIGRPGANSQEMVPPAPLPSQHPPLPPGAVAPSVLSPALHPSTSAACPHGQHKDIFVTFANRLSTMRQPLSAVFARYDGDGDGQLGTAELGALVRAVVPEASVLDVAHVMSVVDLDGSGRVNQQELAVAGEQQLAISAAVRQGRDEGDVMPALGDYLTENEDLVRMYFKEADADRNGVLEHQEIADFVGQIPGMEPQERKFIISYLYQCDTLADGRMTYDQLRAAVLAFGTPQAQAVLQQQRVGTTP